MSLYRLLVKNGSYNRSLLVQVKIKIKLIVKRAFK